MNTKTTMRRFAFASVIGFGLLVGCVGHLEFDPHADAGGAAPSNNNNGNGNPPGNNNTVGGNNPVANNGSGGWGGAGPSGSGGQAQSGTGGSYGSTADTGGARPDAGAPAANDGAAIADDGGTAASACPAGVNVLTDVFAAKCGGCHGATAPTKNLDMVSAGLGARMVNKVSTCMNLPLIAGTLTNNKPTGLLFQKLAGKVTNCGVQMPAGGTPLTTAELACVNDWAVAAIAKVTGK